MGTKFVILDIKYGLTFGDSELYKIIKKWQKYYDEGGQKNLFSSIFFQWWSNFLDKTTNFGLKVLDRSENN